MNKVNMGDTRTGGSSGAQFHLFPAFSHLHEIHPPSQGFSHMTPHHSTPRPAQALTVAAAIAAVCTWEDISPGRRRAFCRALTTIATLERSSADSVTLDAKRSIGLLEAASPAQMGLQASSLANLRAGLRFVLRRLGLLAPRRAATPQVKQREWASLLEKLPEDVAFHRLRQFVAFCAERGISPQAVSLQTLEDYGLQREATWGGAKRADHMRRVAALWRRAAKLLPEWPQTPIKPAPERQLSFDFDAYPAPLAEEVETYLWEIGAPETVIEIFDHDSSRPAVTKATVTTRKYGLRRLFFWSREEWLPHRTHQLSRGCGAGRFYQNDSFVPFPPQWPKKERGYSIACRNHRIGDELPQDS
jgi:hypothetical protein